MRVGMGRGGVKANNCTKLGAGAKSSKSPKTQIDTSPAGHEGAAPGSPLSPERPHSRAVAGAWTWFGPASPTGRPVQAATPDVIDMQFRTIVTRKASGRCTLKKSRTYVRTLTQIHV